MEINTSWAVLPFLAIALYPFIVFTDNLIINLEDLPFTLVITAGVIVLIFELVANFFNTGISKSKDTPPIKNDNAGKTTNKPIDIKKSGICLPLVSLSFFAYVLINNMQIITAKIE